MMNFSSISTRSWVGRILRLPLKLIPETTILPVLQGPMRGQHWIVGSFNHGCWLGSYEFDKQKLFAKYLHPGDCVYDIGAHVGFYTLLSSVLVTDVGIVYAFEPLPRNQKYLRQHIALNHRQNVIVFDVAVGRESKQVQFSAHAVSAMGSVRDDGDLTVEQVGIDEFVDLHDLRPPNVIKIDVEGAEYDVLQGAAGILRSFKPTIFLATHNESVHQHCTTYLQNCGYRLQSITNAAIADSRELIAIPV